MKQANKRRFLYFQILFLMIYFADALFYSYTTLYLSSLGLKESTIGQTINHFRYDDLLFIGQSHLESFGG